MKDKWVFVRPCASINKCGSGIYLDDSRGSLFKMNISLENDHYLKNDPSTIGKWAGRINGGNRSWHFYRCFHHIEIKTKKELAFFKKNARKIYE